MSTETADPPTSCSVEGCAKAQGEGPLCYMHRARLARTGTTDPGPKSAESRKSRFWASVVRGEGECWGWAGQLNNKGYGKVGQLYAHRFSYELHHGPIPKGLFVMHRCDNPPCTNPDHLTVGTAAANSADAAHKGRLSNKRARTPGKVWHNAKLTEADVHQIRDLAATGATQRGVARRFGINQQTVWSILNRKTWSHL